MIEKFETVNDLPRQIAILINRRRPDPRTRFGGNADRTERKRRVELAAATSTTGPFDPVHLLLALRAEPVFPAAVAAAADRAGKQIEPGGNPFQQFTHVHAFLPVPAAEDSCSDARCSGSYAERR